jgi:hypothetical protein
MITVRRNPVPALALTGAALALALAACDKAPAPADSASPPSSMAANTGASSDGSTTLVGDAGSGQAPAEAGYATPTAYSDAPPPPLPTYDQPPIPADGYVWTPGYWDWDESAADYYWSPGTWVQPPRPGLLWTPGYWRSVGGRYGFAPGHWGARVGFYGGVDYGYGYDGEGYRGGHWQGDHFAYNQTVNNTGAVHVAAVYSEPAGRRGGGASFNGGAGGVSARPTPAQIAPAREIQLPPTGDQIQHAQAARGEPSLRAAVNHGQPTIAATSRPGLLHGDGVVTAGAAPVRAEPPRAVEPARAEAAPRPGDRPRPVYNSESPGPVRPAPRPVEPRLPEPARAPAHPAAPIGAERAPRPQPEAEPRPAAESRPPAEPHRPPEGERR